MISDIKRLFLTTSQLRELTINSNIYCYNLPQKLLKHWEESQFRPSNLNVTTMFTLHYSYNEKLFDYATQITTIPTGTTACFRLYDRSRKVPLNFSPMLPCIQLQVEGCNQVNVPFVKFSDFGILGLKVDFGVVTDCQYGGRTMQMVKYLTDNETVNSLHIAQFGSISCATHFDLSGCLSLHSGHLEQLAIACPNLQRLNWQDCGHCLKGLQGLQAIVIHCHNLQGLNLLGICVLEVQDHVLLWEILHDMKLTHLAVDFCVLESEAANKEKLICLYQNCWTVRGLQCCYCDHCGCEDSVLLSYFPSLNCCYFEYFQDVPTFVQMDVINSCKEVKSITVHCMRQISLNVPAHNRNLQQLFIYSTDTDIVDDFMTSVSAHGGLVHVVMLVGSLTAEGITSLVRNSPNLITLNLRARTIFHECVNVETFNAKIKRTFYRRRLFTSGHYVVFDRLPLVHYMIWELTDLLSLWAL